MIDIVIPLGKGSVWGNNHELKYCLRGIEKHLSNVGNLYIVSNKLPSWLTNATLLCADDEKGVEWKDRNIYNKILLACDTDSLSEDFLFMNDDHFMQLDFQLPDFPYYYREHDMQETIDKNIKNKAWRTSIENTRNYLINNGYECKMFDTHTPIIYNKFQFKKLSKLNWDTPYGYGIKSLYANINRIHGTLCKDGKLFPSETSDTSILKRVLDKPCFSTSSYVPIQQQAFIESLYTEKSKYER
jgi:hypothetical protein